MKIEEIAKQLANKINQEHYIMHYLEKVQRGAYNKGLKDAESEKLVITDVVASLPSKKKLWFMADVIVDRQQKVLNIPNKKAID